MQTVESGKGVALAVGSIDFFQQSTRPKYCEASVGNASSQRSLHSNVSESAIIAASGILGADGGKPSSALTRTPGLRSKMRHLFCLSIFTATR